MIGKRTEKLHALFYLGLALFVCHELDAVARHEWMLLPILNQMHDETARNAFILLHIPLFALLFWLTGHRSDVIRLRSQLAIDGFLLVHAVLHLSVSGSETYEFTGPVETITVYGGALIGCVHAFLILRSRSKGRISI